MHRRTRCSFRTRLHNEHLDDGVPGPLDCPVDRGPGDAEEFSDLRGGVFASLVDLPLDHIAASVNAAIIAAFAAHLKRTLTWDQGVEMSWYEELTEATGVPIFFAELSSPWQRGANENFNGLARQYFPKGTNLALHSAEHVDFVVQELNDRPRKTLGYDTPTERFNAERDTPESNPR